HSAAGCRRDGVRTARQLVDNLPLRKEHQTAVAIGVIADRMPGGNDLARKLRMLFDVFAENKECRRHTMLLEQCQQLRRNPWIGTVVERQGASLTGTAYRGTKQLRT